MPCRERGRYFMGNGQRVIERLRGGVSPVLGLLLGPGESWTLRVQQQEVLLGGCWNEGAWGPWLVACGSLSRNGSSDRYGGYYKEGVAVTRGHDRNGWLGRCEG